MVRVSSERLRDDPVELRFDFFHGLSRRKPGSIANAKDMRVDCERLLSKCGVEDHIGSLAADSRQRLQLFSRLRNLAVEPVDQCLAKGDHVLRLRVEQPDGLD